MTLSEFICGTSASALQADEVLLEKTRRSQRVRTRQSLLSLVLVGVVAAGYMWSLWDRTNHQLLTLWVLLILALTVWRSLISKRIRETLDEAGPVQLEKNESELVFTGISIPLIIGAGYWLFCTPDDSVTTLSVTLLCCLYAIGSTINTVAQRRMQSLMVVLNLGQGVLYFTLLSTTEDWAIAIQVLALTLLLLAFGKRLQEMFVDLVKSDLEVKLQNERLLQNRIEIETALDEAVEANKAKSRFLAAASHDLSQPLHAMSMFIGNLKQTAAGDDYQQSIVRKIEDTAEILKQQFDGLLDLSRYDADGVKVQLEPFDLRALCELTMQSERISAEEKNVKLSIVGERATVNSDPVLLGRLVGNLLRNAIKFTDEGEVQLKIKHTDDQVILSVTDSGCGFSEAEKDVIFQDFVQLNNSARNRNNGAGLGLSIVRRISTLLDIDLQVKSTPGVGSEFALTIPLADSVIASIHHDRSASVAKYLEQASNGHKQTQIDLTGYRILIVDDDPVILDALSEYIKSRGGSVLSAASHEEAYICCDLSQDESAPVDFVIVDDMLGDGASGLDLALTISNDIAMKQIIIVTGNIVPQRMEILRSSGFGIYSKPLSGQDLDEILQQRLSPGRKRASA